MLNVIGTVLKIVGIVLLVLIVLIAGFLFWLSRRPFVPTNYTKTVETGRALEAKYRVVIYLYYYEGYDIREIAGLLQLPQGTVGTRLRRARQQLKKYLSEEASV